MGLNLFLLIIKVSDFMPFGIRSKDKSTSKVQQIYPVQEFQKPSSIPLDDEIKNQRGKLKETESPFEATKKAYEVFGLDLNVHYSINDGKLSVGAMAFSEKEAMRLIEYQRESIKKALGIEI